MAIIAIIAIDAPYLQLVLTVFFGYRLVAGKHISPAPLCFPPSRPPFGGMPRPAAMGFFAGFCALQRKRGPAPRCVLQAVRTQQKSP